MGKVNGILTSRTIHVCGCFYGVLLGLMITVKHQLPVTQTDKPAHILYQLLD